MKKYTLIIMAFVAGIALTFVVINQLGAAALSVNDVGTDPAAYTGTITITGIMAGVSRLDPAVIGIMDKKELQCTTPNCNKLYIPVKVQGGLPRIGDEVRVTGSFVNMPGGYLFMADKVKVVRNHRIGG